MRRLLVCDLGAMAYGEALELQRAVAGARGAGVVTDDVLLLVEHPPVITLGRAARGAHLVASPALLEARGVECHDVDRGGDVTFHGPGQLVGYPILDLRQHRQDLHWYLRELEGALIEALFQFGVEGTRNPGYTGVWVQGRKIASIGVHARDWVTWHGFALNVTTDLSYFDLIVPCGIHDVVMTSVQAERSRASRGHGESATAGVAAIDLPTVGAAVVSSLATSLRLEATPTTVGDLRARVSHAHAPSRTPHTPSMAAIGPSP